MAIYSKKGKDPTEVALSAIQDALNIRDTEAPPGAATASLPIAEAANEGRRRGPRAAAKEAPLDAPLMTPGRDDRDMVLAANDDQESIGQVLQSLQRRPSRTPVIIAHLFTALWTLSALFLVVGFSGQLHDLFGAAGWAPTSIGLIGAFCAPVVFFYALANMVARSNELRIVANSMAEATLRFADPESVARDSMVSVGQAIRREVAAMGDGLERALARAAELETLVNNEVTALERAYNDNELRIRTLLDGLASQRETLVGQAEQVRTAITNVHLDLSHDIASVSEAVADRVNEAAQRIARTLSEKGEHIKVALDQAGDSMIDSLGQRGTDLLERLERTSDDTTQAIDTASDRLTSSLNFKSDALNEQFIEIATNLQQSLAGRLDGVVGGFSEKTSSVLQNVEQRTRELTDSINDRSEVVSRELIDTTGRLAETIAMRAEEVNNSLRTTGE